MSQAPEGTNPGERTTGGRRPANPAYPAASFDAEVARIADEHNADVVVRLVEREDLPMNGQRCCLGCDNPAFREYTLKCDGHETVRDMPLCEQHAKAIITHDPKAYDAIKADRAAEYRHMAENNDSRLLHPHDPNRDRARNSDGTGRGLEMRTPPPPDTHRESTLGGASTEKDGSGGRGFLLVEVTAALRCLEVEVPPWRNTLAISAASIEAAFE